MSVIDLTVNGRRRRLEVDPSRTLLAVLRWDLGLTGTHYGCGEGQCGACCVIIDGNAARACLTRVGDAAGRAVRTIEGLADGERLHPVQQAFVDQGAMQCGYCTPGMIMGCVALLQRTGSPSEEEIRRALRGHVCRCGTYLRIIEAVKRVAAPADGEGR